MENARYHVLLEGRQVGPYDRRTIVGMRIRKTLTSADVLVGPRGVRLTVGELVRQPRPDSAFQPSRSGSYSVVQATCSAWVAGADRPLGLPAFKGEVEVRVQTKVLRIAGRFRQGFGWKEGRWKVPVREVVQARVRGSLVDLGVQAQPGGPVHALTLELFTPESAAEFAQNVPHAQPWPEGAPTGRPVRLAAIESPVVWAAVAGSAALVGGMVLWALLPR